MKIITILLTIVICALSGAAQEGQTSDNSADTSGAQAAIQRMKKQVAATTADPASAPTTTVSIEGGSCQSAVRYVDSPVGLSGEWERTYQRYLAYRNGQSLLKSYKRDLLSDSWWAASSGPDIAREIKFVCDVVGDIFGALNPSGNPFDTAKDFGLEIKKREAKIYEAVAGGKDVVEAINEGTDGLAEFAIKEEGKRLGAGRWVSILNALEKAKENIKTAEDGAQYKATVREQIQKMDELVNQLQNGVDAQKDRLEAIESIKNAVISACNTKPRSDLSFAPSSNLPSTPSWTSTPGTTQTPSSPTQPLPLVVVSPAATTKSSQHPSTRVPQQSGPQKNCPGTVTSDGVCHPGK